ncbi:MAG: NAD(P)H-hydrate dehydratase [Gammaproteobacteria bacterium]|nr:NAD(P)H-hydrate dehydratase [Gammaproteobacteria bacterium]
MQLYTAAQTRELDRIAIEEHGISGIRLMTRAGRAAFAELLARWPDPACLHIFCGTGNNGGDGFILAELAADRGIPVIVYQLGEVGRIAGDALEARVGALAVGVHMVAADEARVLDEGVIVDAMLGTGLSGEVRPAYAAAIAQINASSLPVLALDIPSGLCSDTGRELGAVVKADCTMTFIAYKQGLLTGVAPDCCGVISFSDLEVPAVCFDAVVAGACSLQLQECLENLSPLPRHAHKGLLGSALIVGGDHGMGGACLMAAEAAARCGAGLVTVATRAEHLPGIIARRPEVMARAVDSAQGLSKLLGRVSVVVCGPGLGQSPWSEQLLHAAVAGQQALVLDADALNLLAGSRVLTEPRRDNWVLTPHPGEAARLLGSSTADVQADRYAAVRELQQRYGGVAVLKGAGSLICAGGQVFVSSYGNPGMASGGMGDVLSGVIAALLAQGLAPIDAACLGVCLHGRAADLAAGNAQRGLLATDLMPKLRQLLGN